MANSIPSVLSLLETKNQTKQKHEFKSFVFSSMSTPISLSKKSSNTYLHRGVCGKNSLKCYPTHGWEWSAGVGLKSHLLLGPQERSVFAKSSGMESTCPVLGMVEIWGEGCNEKPLLHDVLEAGEGERSWMQWCHKARQRNQALGINAYYVVSFTPSPAPLPGAWRWGNY